LKDQMESMLRHHRTSEPSHAASRA